MQTDTVHVEEQYDGRFRHLLCRTGRRTGEGYTALDFARLTGWQNVADLLEPRH
ncbi:TPA: hypothetical protein WMW16_000155 [Neisseria gonorrhoeae]